MEPSVATTVFDHLLTICFDLLLFDLWVGMGTSGLISQAQNKLDTFYSLSFFIRILYNFNAKIWIFISIFFASKSNRHFAPFKRISPWSKYEGEALVSVQPPYYSICHICDPGIHYLPLIGTERDKHLAWHIWYQHKHYTILSISTFPHPTPPIHNSKPYYPFGRGNLNLKVFSIVIFWFEAMKVKNQPIKFKMVWFKNNLRS